MAPSVLIDPTSDWQQNVNPSEPAMERVLLLSPPSLASHPQKLNTILSSYNKDVTDLQMLDRLAAGLVSLPKSTYDVVMLLTDADGTRSESRPLMGREMIQSIVHTLRPGGKLKSEDMSFARADSPERVEVILAGLTFDDTGGVVKPDFGAQDAVPIAFGKKRLNKPAAQYATETNFNAVKPPQNVGFIDFSDDFAIPIAGNGGDELDDELIDEDTLLDEEDMGRPIIQPPECRPKAGKRRRACKDCTCGLAERIQAEDTAKRSDADRALEAMKLGANDLAEVDFTVQGKVGSCGNCALGDAFRCDGCPYVGLPPFKPGEEVRLVNNDVQL